MNSRLPLSKAAVAHILWFRLSATICSFHRSVDNSSYYFCPARVPLILSTFPSLLKFFHLLFSLVPLISFPVSPAKLFETQISARLHSLPCPLSLELQSRCASLSGSWRCLR
jgi:hypothetical protein